MTSDDPTIDAAVRQARAAAARADPARTASDVVAALAAGSGAELVARQYFAREALADRASRRDASRDPPPDVEHAIVTIVARTYPASGNQLEAAARLALRLGWAARHETIHESQA